MGFPWLSEDKRWSLEGGRERERMEDERTKENAVRRKGSKGFALVLLYLELVVISSKP